MAFGPSSGQASDSCLPLGSVAVIPSASALFTSPLIPRKRQVGLLQGRIGLVDRGDHAVLQIGHPPDLFAPMGQASGQFRRVESHLLGLLDRPLKIPARHAALDRRHGLGVRRVELTLFDATRGEMAGVCRRGWRASRPASAGRATGPASPPGRSPPSASWPGLPREPDRRSPAPAAGPPGPGRTAAARRC